MVSQETKNKKLSPRRRKKLVRVIAATLIDAGWLGLMWALWVHPSDVGTMLSIICIFAGDYLAVFED